MCIRDCHTSHALWLYSKITVKHVAIVVVGLVLGDYAVNLDFAAQMDAIWLAPVGGRAGVGVGGSGERIVSKGRTDGSGRRRGDRRDAILDGGSGSGSGAIEGSFEEEDEEELLSEAWGQVGARAMFFKRSATSHTVLPCASITASP